MKIKSIEWRKTGRATKEHKQLGVYCHGIEIGSVSTTKKPDDVWDGESETSTYRVKIFDFWAANKGEAGMDHFYKTIHEAQDALIEAINNTANVFFE